MAFSKWLDTLIEEKVIDTETLLEIEGASGINIIPLSIVLDAIKSTRKEEKTAIKTMLVKIDFANGDILDYFRHLAKAIAI